MSSHVFDVKIATLYGMEVAVIINNLYFWIKKNTANRINFYDGNCWTYNSVKAFQELFPYLGEKQIRNALEKMKQNDLIVTGNYNKVAYDRTLWYALTEKGYALFGENKPNFPNSPFKRDEKPFGEKANEFVEMPNQFTEMGEPIPDINTDVTSFEKHYKISVKPKSFKEKKEVQEIAQAMLDNRDSITTSINKEKIVENLNIVKTKIIEYVDSAKNLLSASNINTIEKFLNSFSNEKHVNNLLKGLSKGCEFISAEEATLGIYKYIEKMIKDVENRPRKKFFVNSLSWFNLDTVRILEATITNMPLIDELPPMEF